MTAGSTNLSCENENESAKCKSMHRAVMFESHLSEHIFNNKALKLTPFYFVLVIS